MAKTTSQQPASASILYHSSTPSFEQSNATSSDSTTAHSNSHRRVSSGRVVKPRPGKLIEDINISTLNLSGVHKSYLRVLPPDWTNPASLVNNIKEENIKTTTTPSQALQFIQTAFEKINESPSTAQQLKQYSMNWKHVRLADQDEVRKLTHQGTAAASTITSTGITCLTEATVDAINNGCNNGTSNNQETTDDNEEEDFDRCEASIVVSFGLRLMRTILNIGSSHQEHTQEQLPPCKCDIDIDVPQPLPKRKRAKMIYPDFTDFGIITDSDGFPVVQCIIIYTLWLEKYSCWLYLGIQHLRTEEKGHNTIPIINPQRCTALFEAHKLASDMDLFPYNLNNRLETSAIANINNPVLAQYDLPNSIYANIRCLERSIQRKMLYLPPNSSTDFEEIALSSILISIYTFHGNQPIKSYHSEIHLIAM
ncbi:hypothetical protein BDA99DRAFT_587428 [Phascolomyces articulosus]|uniref:Uncharacterized protein n=1 Tax=Phascolomyces articulosus TaxID=60185 RepID=A0AAD5PAG3_9FUNG|nr:hypothetical protein BDA99DRAFT_587428 [Phascolomyces articulosus]